MCYVILPWEVSNLQWRVSRSIKKDYKHSASWSCLFNKVHNENFKRKSLEKLRGSVKEEYLFSASYSCLSLIEIHEKSSWKENLKQEVQRKKKSYGSIEEDEPT